MDDRQRKVDEKTEELEVAITTDDGDEQETLSAGPMTKKDRDYLREEAKSLRYMDDMIEDSIANGDEDAAEFWSEQYNKQKCGMEVYMKKRHIPYRMSRGQDVQKEARSAENVFNAIKLPTLEGRNKLWFHTRMEPKPSKKKVISKRRESKGRSLERTKNS